jgi:hypothetical protein
MGSSIAESGILDSMRAFPIVLLTLVPSALSCGSSSSSPTSAKANPCATRGASYLEAFTEESGNCGTIPSELVNVGSDGTLTESTPITCATVSQTGCTARDSDCTFSSMGYNFTETSDVTFTADGSSASGVVTLSGSGNGQVCTSTYDITFTRQAN